MSEYNIILDHERLFTAIFTGSILDSFLNAMTEAARSNWNEDVNFRVLYDKFPYQGDEVEWKNGYQTQIDLDNFYEYIGKHGYFVETTEPEMNYEDMDDSFVSFIDRLRELMYEDKKSRLLWMFLSLYVSVVNLSVKDINTNILLESPQISSILDFMKQKQSYQSILDEYNDLQKGSVSKDIIKSLDPVDTSLVPEYVLSDLYLSDGKYYRPSEIRKMMTAAGQVAQTLERQDLEGDMTNDGEDLLTAEEIGRNYIKKLKLKREKKR